MILFIVSTIAEVSVFGWLSYTAYAEMKEQDDEDLRVAIIVTGCSFAGWVVLRVFMLFTLHKFYTEMVDGGVEEGINLHSKASSNTARSDQALATGL